MSGISQPASELHHTEIADRYAKIRAATIELVEPLTEEDCCVQSQTCCSPVKWHLGHTSWFFERFIVRDALGAEPYDDRFEFVFNSYYNKIGGRQPRARRGLLTRPGLGEIMAYRDVIDERVVEAIRNDRLPQEAYLRIELGLNHEQQHQELLLMDIKHLFSCNPIGVEYTSAPMMPAPSPGPLEWVSIPGGLAPIGIDHSCDTESFDIEGPAHRVHLEPFELSNRLVTNGEYLAFLEDGGYSEPGHWLDLAWQCVCADTWGSPLYWERRDDAWYEFSLRGWQPLDPDLPVSHLSLFEADAYARWAGARLPTEFELETAWTQKGNDGALLEDRTFHPAVADTDGSGLHQLAGDLWEWTSSSYGPYPGYCPPRGAEGEYNGKFMCNQYVLRGGCCATPRDHLRKTYRNFYDPSARWAFSGVRLARTL